MRLDVHHDDALKESWTAAWPEALAHWSRFTKLRDPVWCFDAASEAREHLSGSFAMIRLNDQSVVISLRQVCEQGLQEFAVEIEAHEIGHHVYAPGSLLEHGRMLARIRPALPTKEHLAPMVANLYTDLLINDRLQRAEGLDMAGVYRKLREDTKTKSGSTWTFYMRMYEILWSLSSGELCEQKPNRRTEGDAQLGARLIRSYARDWLNGSGRFAALILPYLLEDGGGEDLDWILRGWRDSRGGGAGSDVPAGLTEVEEGELSGAIHPARDPDLTGFDEPEPVTEPPKDTDDEGGSAGQYREPFEYGELLKALGLNLNDHEIAVRYYRERAVPHLIRFPVRRMPESTEPMPEGLTTWEIGSPLEDADWFHSVLASPRIVPGVTTLQRTWGVVEGAEPEKRPLDLDLYVDCSGSMPNPQAATSFLALAGAIVAISAMRVGAKVQATLWSGPRQFETTGGFVNDLDHVLRILTGYLGGSTAFPIHILRDTYRARKSERPAHILVLSDDGVDTMFQKDEQGNDGHEVARAALAKAGGGGTLVLNLWRESHEYPELVNAATDGWRIHRVQNWEDLVAFARAFSKGSYELGG